MNHCAGECGHAEPRDFDAAKRAVKASVDDRDLIAAFCERFYDLYATSDAPGAMAEWLSGWLAG